MPDPLAKAACKGRSDIDWFPVTATAANRAITVCRVCPVSKACCEEADQRKEQWGVWGGIWRSSKSSVKRRQRADMEMIWETGVHPIRPLRRKRQITEVTVTAVIVTPTWYDSRRNRAAEGYE